jgi:hypothetical protein
LHASTVRQQSGKISVAVVNRYQKTVLLRLSLPGAIGNFRAYVYDAAKIPQNRFGNLQAPSRVLAARNGALLDQIPANSLIVYTNNFENIAPAAPRTVNVSDATKSQLLWAKNSEKDVGCYHVYRGATANFALTPSAQIASTSATNFVDDGTINSGDIQSTDGKFFAVVAVDSSGNASRATYAKAP